MTDGIGGTRVKLNLHTEKFFLKIWTSPSPNQSLPPITSPPPLPGPLDPPYPAIACSKQIKEKEADPKTKE